MSVGAGGGRSVGAGGASTPVPGGWEGVVAVSVSFSNTIAAILSVAALVIGQSAIGTVPGALFL